MQITQTVQQDLSKAISGLYNLYLKSPADKRGYVKQIDSAIRTLYYGLPELLQGVQTALIGANSGPCEGVQAVQVCMRARW
jgi:hypothetical protein